MAESAHDSFFLFFNLFLSLSAFNFANFHFFVPFIFLFLHVTFFACLHCMSRILFRYNKQNVAMQNMISNASLKQY